MKLGLASADQTVPPAACRKRVRVDRTAEFLGRQLGDFVLDAAVVELARRRPRPHKALPAGGLRDATFIRCTSTGRNLLR